MTARLVPLSTTELMDAPELAAFAILDVALVVTRHALEAHTLCGDDSVGVTRQLRATLVAAHEVVWAADELRDRMSRYRRALEHLLGPATETPTDSDCDDDRLW